MSALITADQIATQHIFKDNRALTFAEVEKTLTDKNTLSENERCYSYIISECDINKNKFVTNYYGDYQGEMWGTYFTEKRTSTHCIAIVPNVFKRICSSGGFSAKAFLSWAVKKEIIFTNNDGKMSKVVKIQNNPVRCYVLKLPDMDEETINDD